MTRARVCVCVFLYGGDLLVDPCNALELGDGDGAAAPRVEEQGDTVHAGHIELLQRPDRRHVARIGEQPGWQLL